MGLQKYAKLDALRGKYQQHNNMKTKNIIIKRVSIFCIQLTIKQNTSNIYIDDIETVL